MFNSDVALVAFPACLKPNVWDGMDFMDGGYLQHSFVSGYAAYSVG